MIMPHTPTPTLKIALAQINPAVGALVENAQLIVDTAIDAAGQGAQIVLFPELVMCGYPPEDLVLKPKFVADCMAMVKSLTTQLPPDVACIIGTPWEMDGKVYNVSAVLHKGTILHIIPKTKLPNYGVFDEMRVFTAAAEIPAPVEIHGVKCAIPICEDIWHADVCAAQAAMGAQLFLVPNGSPYWKGKSVEREAIARQRVMETGIPMVYVNRTGGQDELVFDGASFVLDAHGAQVLHMAEFVEGVEVVELNFLPLEGGGTPDRGGVGVKPAMITPSVSHAFDSSPLKGEREKSLYTACVVGVRDYVNRNGFKSVVLGLSGGVDSALCAAIAVDALGAQRVHGVMMPYTYTAQESLEDAAECAKNLGISYEIIPISPAVEAMQTMLAPQFTGHTADLTEENIQSRVRGMVLMALSNKFGHMVVTTGNKSEMAVGYCTLYGDMNGGFNPIKDLYKTEVYRVCEWRNGHNLNLFPLEGGSTPHSGGMGVSDTTFGIITPSVSLRSPAPPSMGSGFVPPIPARILTKAPSAELRPDQKDQDSLPPYDVLDAILEGLVEHEQSVDDLIHQGFAHDTVRRVERLLNLAEYKRRQAAPGVKLTRRNFGRDRRYPITHGYKS